MTNALDDLNEAFTTRTGIKVVTRYGASSALMKQIESGAPADAFVSADLKWMDYGVDKKVINESTRIYLLGNVLMLIAAKDSKIDHIDIEPGFELTKLAGDGRIATGDIKAVPVGLYAKAALEKLGVWPPVESKMAMTVNVRAALGYVARGEAPLSIVYATDMRSKTDQIRTAWATGDRIRALRVAARFFDRSEDTKNFKRGIDAFNHPDFYRQIGKEPQESVAAALALPCEAI